MTSAVVLDFGPKVTICKIIENKKSYSCVDVVETEESADKFFEHRDALENLLEKLSREVLAGNTIPLIVTVSDSRYIFYHTDVMSHENLLSFDNKMNAQEKEEIFLENCRNLKPAGLNYISDDVVACCMASYFNSNDVYLSCAFLSEKLVVTINDVTEKLGIILLGIKPFAYGIFNAYMDLGVNLIFELKENFLIMNEYGLIVWDKSGNYNTEDVVAFLKEECLRIFDMGSDSRETVLVNIQDTAYLKNSVQGVCKSFEAVSAIGCFMGHKEKNKDILLKKGEKLQNGSSNSIWQFFKKKVRR